jgi:4-hydroxy-tetrahydrodipicolinate synthase
MIAEVVLMGGHGGVNGGANLFPELYVALYNAALSRDFERIAELQHLVMEISTKVYTLGSYGSSYLKGVKGALSALGIIESNLAMPFNAFEEKEMLQVIATIKSIQEEILKKL